MTKLVHVVKYPPVQMAHVHANRDYVGEPLLRMSFSERPRFHQYLARDVKAFPFVLLPWDTERILHHLDESL